jgi:uncharacterized protein Veg
MNKNTAKSFVFNNLNVRHKFIYKGMRNQNEEFYGVICNMYPAIFLIKLDDGSIKSFSYNDIIINNIIIKNIS